MQPKKLSRYIDDPPYILFWRLPEAATLMLMVFFGIAFNNLLIFSLAGFVLNYIMRVHNRKQKKGYLLHIFYRVGLLYTKAKTFPNPFIKKFVE